MGPLPVKTGGKLSRKRDPLPAVAVIALFPSLALQKEKVLAARPVAAERWEKVLP